MDDAQETSIRQHAVWTEQLERLSADVMSCLRAGPVCRHAPAQHMMLEGTRDACARVRACEDGHSAHMCMQHVVMSRHVSARGRDHRRACGAHRPAPAVFRAGAGAGGGNSYSSGVITYTVNSVYCKV